MTDEQLADEYLPRAGWTPNPEGGWTPPARRVRSSKTLTRRTDKSGR